MPKKVTASKATTKKAVTTSTAARVKKAPAKKVVKKSPTRPVITEPLRYADNETSFWVADGKILNSLVALHEALLVMDAKTFTHHVTKDKNDFAEWVSDVLGDEACSAELKKSKTAKSAATTVKKSLKFYSY